MRTSEWKYLNGSNLRSRVRRHTLTNAVCARVWILQVSSKTHASVASFMLVKTSRVYEWEGSSFEALDTTNKCALIITLPIKWMKGHHNIRPPWHVCTEKRLSSTSCPRACMMFEMVFDPQVSPRITVCNNIVLSPTMLGFIGCWSWGAYPIFLLLTHTAGCAVALFRKSCPPVQRASRNRFAQHSFGRVERLWPRWESSEPQKESSEDGGQYFDVRAVGLCAMNTFGHLSYLPYLSFIFTQNNRNLKKR